MSNRALESSEPCGGAGLLVAAVEGVYILDKHRRRHSARL